MQSRAMRIRARALELVSLRPGEGRRTLLAALYLALIIASYIVGKAVRDSRFVDRFGALGLPYAIIAVAFGVLLFLSLYAVCLYLAFHYGVHAANYPLTEENLEAIHGEAPPVLVPYRKKLCGLTISPERLEQIRARRLPGSRYVSFAQCRTEIVRAEAIFASLKLPVFNVTSMSMEEIAVAILDTMHLPRR